MTHHNNTFNSSPSSDSDCETVLYYIYHYMPLNLARRFVVILCHWPIVPQCHHQFWCAWFNIVLLYDSLNAKPQSHFKNNNDGQKRPIWARPSLDRCPRELDCFIFKSWPALYLKMSIGRDQVKFYQSLPFQYLFVNHLKREQLVQKLVKGNINHP